MSTLKPLGAMGHALAGRSTTVGPLSTDCSGMGAGDLTVSNAMLEPLSDNGGPVKTIALLPGSPAIDAGATLGTVKFDARGVSRPQGSHYDIGAFETRGFSLAPSNDGQHTFVNTPFASDLAVTLTEKLGKAVPGAAVTFTVTSGSATFAGGATTVTLVVFEQFVRAQKA